MEDAATSNSILQACGLRKEFFRKGRNAARYFDAVSQINLNLQPATLTELIGRSGSGKSTLLNMCAGLLKPTEGTVTIKGTDIYALDDAALSQWRNRYIGVIPQGQSALHNLTVLQNVVLPWGIYHASEDVEKRALELLATLEIDQLCDAYPAELSGGEMRRMAIARALICKPALLLADEPTGDLDNHNTETVLELLRSVADDGAAVLLVTHEQSAAAYADSLYTLDGGRLV